MQSLVSILSGTGTADAAKQGTLAQLAPANIAADATGLTFSDLFKTLLPIEEARQAEIGDVRTKVVEGDLAPQANSSEDPDTPPTATELPMVEQADTPDQTNPKTAPASLTQPDEIAGKRVPSPQPNFEGWAAVHQVKPPSTSALPHPKMPLPTSGPIRHDIASPGDQIRPPSNSDQQKSGVPLIPNLQQQISQPLAPSRHDPAPIKTHAQISAFVPPQTMVEQNSIPLKNPVSVTKDGTSIAVEKPAISQPGTAFVRTNLEQKMPEIAAETPPMKQPSKTQNPLPALIDRAQMQARPSSSFREGGPHDVVPETSKAVVSNSTAPAPMVNRETAPTPVANKFAPIQQARPEVSLRNPPRAAPATPQNTQYTPLQIPNSAPAVRIGAAPATVPLPNSAVAVAAADQSKEPPFRAPATEQTAALPRRPDIRGFEPQFGPLPPAQKTATQIRKIEPRHVTIAQQQAPAASPAEPQFNATSAAQTMPKLQSNQQSIGRSAPSTGADFALPLRTDVTAAPGSIAQVAARPELASHIAQQIADAVQALPNRPVEITLNPEELGRLKLQLTTSEAGIAVHVSAERPETMELLRRHISILDQEFLKLGFDDIAFSFAGGQGPMEQTDPSNDQSPDQQVETGDHLPTTATAPTRATLPGAGGLDLRV